MTRLLAAAAAVVVTAFLSGGCTSGEQHDGGPPNGTRVSLQHGQLGTYGWRTAIVQTQRGPCLEFAVEPPHSGQTRLCKASLGEHDVGSFNTYGAYPEPAVLNGVTSTAVDRIEVRFRDGAPPVVVDLSSQGPHGFSARFYTVPMNGDLAEIIGTDRTGRVLGRTICRDGLRGTGCPHYPS